MVLKMEEKVSRRGYLKYAGAGVVVVAAAGAGAYYATRPGPAATTTTSEQTQEEKATIRILCHDYDVAPLLANQVAQAYNEYTNGRVTVSVDQFPYETLHEKIIVEMSAGSREYDMIVTDGEWAAELYANNWIRSLSELKRQDSSLPDIMWDNYIPEVGDPETGFVCTPHFKNALAVAKVDVPGYDYWGIPLSHGAQSFTYRKDLYEKYGVDKVPTNWDEYLEAAKKLTRPEDDLYGAEMLMGSSTIAFNEFSFRMAGMGPSPKAPNMTKANFGYFFDDNLMPVFNDDRGYRALEHMKNLLPYCPPGTLGMDWPDLQLYREGKIGQVVVWWDCFPGIEVPEMSKVAGLSGYAPIPYDKELHEWAGGFSMWITRFSQKPTESYKFMAWMSEGEAYNIIEDQGVDVGSGLFPVMKHHVSDPGLRAKLPQLNLWDQITGKLVNYPIYLPELPEIYQITWEEFSKCLKDEKTIQGSLDDAADRIYNLLKEHGRYE